MDNLPPLATPPSSSTLEDKALPPPSDASTPLSPRSNDTSSSSLMKLQEIRQTTSSVVYSTDENMRPVTRDAPGGAKAVRLSSAKQELARKRSQYYGEVFAYRASTNSPRDRIARDSIVVAELRTSLILDDELSLMTDISLQLSQRYQRPESCIFVTVQPSACMLLGGSYEPAYIMTITALPGQIAPTVNKRNAALLQSFLAEELGISSNRGVIRFSPVEEGNLATKGITTLGEIEELERTQSAEDGGQSFRTISRTRSLKKKHNQHFPSPTTRPRSKTAELPTPPRSAGASDESKGHESQSRPGPGQKKMKRRKSLMAFFGK